MKASAMRTPKELSPSLAHRLALYALAANAAGIGLVAAEPAEAKIVYHKVDIVIENPGHHSLALTGNHQADFNFVNSYDAHNFFMFAKPLRNNRVWGLYGYASVLNSGAPIGPNSQHFNNGNQFLVQVSTVSSGHKGNWYNITNGYLGLKFIISGKVHYGWARLTTESAFKDTLTGYAYETVPNKLINAGQTKGPDEATVEAGTLGRLAQGKR
jgi:hypothetical protein